MRCPELSLELELEKKIRIRDVEKVMLKKNKVCYERFGKTRCYSVNDVIIYSEEEQMFNITRITWEKGNVIITSDGMDLIISLNDKRAYIVIH